MPPQSIILMLIGTWLLVAAATLWGMLRIARRHHERQHARPTKPAMRAAPARHKPVRIGH
jgi:hypothetical protein